MPTPAAVLTRQTARYEDWRECPAGARLPKQAAIVPLLRPRLAAVNVSTASTPVPRLCNGAGYSHQIVDVCVIVCLLQSISAADVSAAAAAFGEVAVIDVDRRQLGLSRPIQSFQVDAEAVVGSAEVAGGSRN